MSRSSIDSNRYHSPHGRNWLPSDESTTGGGCPLSLSHRGVQTEHKQPSADTPAPPPAVSDAGVGAGAVAGAGAGVFAVGAAHPVGGCLSDLAGGRDVGGT